MKGEGGRACAESRDRRKERARIRDEQVRKLAAEGYNNVTIARRLGMSPNGVSTIRNRIGAAPSPGKDDAT